MKKLLFSFISILAISCFSNANAQIPVGPGNVSGTWTASSHYQVNGDINVASGDTLNIQPGVTVEFMGHYRMTVQGHLFALGEEGDSIRFTKADTNGLANRNTPNGSWNGIIHVSGSVGHLSYCIVEHCNTYEDGATSYYQESAVDGDHAELTVTHSLIQNNYGFVGGGARVQYGECEFRDNMFRFNTGYEGAGGLGFSSNSKKIAEGNIFIKNKGYYGGAFYVWRGGLKIIIKNNFISQNEASQGGGIYATTESGPQVIQNIIVNNSAVVGGAIFYQNCGKVLVNNTICNNYASSGGALYFSSPSLMDGTNNIFWGNRKSGNILNQIYITNGATATFRNTVCQDSPTRVEGNPGDVTWDSLYTGTPIFQNATIFAGKDFPSDPEDWTILTNSSCLNLGTRNYFKADEHNKDFFDNERIKYGHIDIGAHEFSDSVLSKNGTYASDQVWMADTIKITGDVIMNGKTDIVPGVVVQFHGYYNIEFNDVVNALGTANDPILFTMNDSTGLANMDSTDGRWKKLKVENADNSVFRYCNFEFGEGLRVRYSSEVTIENCIFENCMTDYSMIYLGDGTHFYLRNCIIRNNNTVSTSWLTFTIDGYNYSYLYIEHNRIYNNQIQAVETNANNTFVHNNLIYNNKGGIHAGEGDNLFFFNNTLAYNTHWGINCGQGTGIIANNIMFGNDNDLSTLPYVDELKIFNNILQDEPNIQNYLIYEDNLIADPMFKNPIPVIGPVDNIENADYSVFSISPVINMGRNTIPGHTLPSVDIAGNSRLHDDQIDIGAFEHTGQKPVITTQPAGGNICQGLSKVLSIVTEPEDTLLYQWQKDGENIPGATGPVYVKDPIMLQDAGNYRCMISNSFGTTYSDQVYVNVSSPAVILTESTSEWIPANETSTFSVNAIGSIPVEYQWYKDGEAIAGATIPELQISSPDSSDEGIYSCTVSNTCGVDSTEAIQVFLIPQICMVTVDEISGQNLIVWEKKTKAPIFAYKIYRESTAAGIYDLIGTVPFDDLSEFEDSIADPKAQAYLYKITATDTEGNETDVNLCRPHKTIHLLVSTHPEYLTSQLGWDNYYGFEYLTYIIFRSTTGVDFAQVQEISSSLNSWTDNDTVQGDLYYRIAVEKPEACDPEGLGKKAGTGPYNHSLSNLDNNKLRTGVRDNYERQVRIFPNPFTQSATLQFPNPEGKAFTLLITDLSGKVLRIEHNISHSSFIIERKSLEKGFYLFELRGDEVYRGRMVVE